MSAEVPGGEIRFGLAWLASLIALRRSARLKGSLIAVSMTNILYSLNHESAPIWLEKISLVGALLMVPATPISY
jgi:hypothetical protein